MAAFQLIADLPEFTLTTSATTVLYVKAPTNQRVKLLGYGFYFDGTLNSAQPVQIVMGRITTFTGSYTAGTFILNEPELTETPQSTFGTGQHGTTDTVVAAAKTFTVHPQLGYEYLAPLGQEFIIGGGQYLGFQVTAPAAVDIRGYALVEE